MAMWPICCTPLAQSSKHACGAGRAPSSAPQRLKYFIFFTIALGLRIRRGKFLYKKGPPEIKGESGLAAIAAGALVVAALWVVQSVVVCAAI